MKFKKNFVLERILRLMAKAILAKYRPTVVGVTGSVGKTSAKEAIFAVLAKEYKVRKNEKNYNNEIGLPLTIIGVETGGKSLLKWLNIFWRWLKILTFSMEYPEILILEMGVDRPGDMKYLTSFVKPRISVVTNISSSHIEFFGSLDKIAKEKGIIAEVLPEDGWAILNADEKLVNEMSLRTKANLLTFGFSESAQVGASGVVYHYNDNVPDGLSFKLNYDGKNIPIRLKGILAKHQINAALSAVAVGLAFKMNLVSIAGALENFNPPPGRLNVINAINDAYLIDDTYNASPASMVAALEVLQELKGGRKIAVLGDMLELGMEEENGHDAVVQKVLENKLDLFFAVGKRMRKAAEKIVQLGFPREQIFFFDDPTKASAKVLAELRKDDLVLIKGSQGMRMEKVVEALLFDETAAEKFLCRQTKDWKTKPYVQP